MIARGGSLAVTLPGPTWTRRAALLSLALTLASMTAPRVDAQTVLHLPASARALGMGDAFVAGRGAEMIFYNPAMLAMQPGLTASMQRYGAASTAASLASTFSNGPLAAGVGAQFVDFSAPAAPGFRLLNLGVRGSEAAASIAGSVGAAMTVKGTRFGIAAKYVEERRAVERDGAAAFDLGAARDMFGRATVGIVAQNLGSSVNPNGRETSLPMQGTLGLSAFSPPLGTYFDVAVTTALTYRRDGMWIPAGGVELSYVPLDGWAITGRLGARRTENEFGARPLTLGAGLAFDRVALDYAWHAMVGETSSHRVGLRLR